jgi:excinuclease ABC subunit A
MSEMKSSRDWILVKGARENNLKNVDVAIPKGSLTVFTGLSGSGKTTLAFDTIYNEGRRRYVESLSSYARQFLGGMEKPDVDSIEGLSPAISIDQKSTSHNPRSTVGTVTEIYDYMRLLFARIGVPYCPNGHGKIESFSPVAMTDAILEFEQGSKIQILSPIVRHEKGSQKDVFEKIKKAGFVRVVAVERAVQPFDDDVDVAEFRRRRREFTAERASRFFVRNRHVEDVVISVQKKVFDFVAALLVQPVFVIAELTVDFR